MTVHTSRDGEVRERKARKRTYKPPQMLETPGKIEGYTLRWKRRQLHNVEDEKNIVSAKFLFDN